VLVLVPILGAVKLLVQNQFGIDINIPLNFLILYAAGLSSIVASVLFDLFCPSIIKTYRSYPQFFREAQLLGVEIIAKNAEIREKRKEILEEIVAAANPDEDRSQPSAPVTPLFQKYTAEISKMEMLWNTGKNWDEENASWLFVRVVVVALYALGAAFTLWVTVVDAPSGVIRAL